MTVAQMGSQLAGDRGVIASVVTGTLAILGRVMAVIHDNHLADLSTTMSNIAVIASITLPIVLLAIAKVRGTLRDERSKDEAAHAQSLSAEIERLKAEQVKLAFDVDRQAALAANALSLLDDRRGEIDRLRARVVELENRRETLMRSDDPTAVPAADLAAAVALCVAAQPN